MEGMIEITGVDLAEVAKAAYDLSRPQGMGYLHYEEGSLSDAAAAELVNDDSRLPLSLDYVRGRACKLTVHRDDEGRLWIANRWFDHSQADLVALLQRLGINDKEVADTESAA